MFMNFILSLEVILHKKYRGTYSMKSKLILSFVFFLISFFISGCNNQQNLTENSRQIFSMDTVMELRAYGENPEKALDLAEEEIIRIDNMLKRSNPDSEIYKINENGKAMVSYETANLINSAVDISKKTNGAFDISITPVIDLWGFYDKKYDVPNNKNLSETLKKVNYKNITIENNIVSLKNGMKIDLGGIAKGFTSDKIMEIFKKNNITSGLVSLGGNVQAFGKKPNKEKWKIGVQNPDDESSYIGTLEIEDEAVITSGGYHRFFEKNGITYHHIIDPKTGFPAKSGVKSVTIISKNGTLADGLSTSLFIMGLQKSIDFWKENLNFEFIIETDTNEIYITEGIKNNFKSTLNYKIITVS